MLHTFDDHIARVIGIEEAIIVHNMYYWIRKNEANGKHFYDGRTWTYNSRSAFSELFIYMSDNAIYRTIASLVKQDIIMKGNYNKLRFDRTCWYAFTDKGLSMLRKANLHCAKSNNAVSETEQTIPDSKQHIVNTNSNKNISTLVDIQKGIDEEEDLINDAMLNTCQDNFNQEELITDVHSVDFSDESNNIQEQQSSKNQKKERKEKSCAKKEKKGKTVRRPYGEYNNIYLTDAELDKLREKRGLKNDLNEVIDYFSREVEMKGYKYENFYLAILKWGLTSYDNYTARNNNQLSRQNTGICQQQGYNNNSARATAADKRAELNDLEAMALAILSQP